MSQQLNSEAAGAVDSGFGAVVMLLRYHGIGADPGWIWPRFVGIAEMRQCSKEFGLRVRVAAADSARLAATPLLDTDLVLDHRKVRLRTIEALKQRPQSVHRLPSITVSGRGQPFRRAPAGSSAQG
jgi:hypothetical protein